MDEIRRTRQEDADVFKKNEIQMVKFDVAASALSKMGVAFRATREPRGGCYIRTDQVLLMNTNDGKAGKMSLVRYPLQCLFQRRRPRAPCFTIPSCRLLGS